MSTSARPESQPCCSKWDPSSHLAQVDGKVELSSTLDKDAGKSELSSDLGQGNVLVGVDLASGPDETGSFICGGYTGNVEPHLEAPLSELRAFLGESGLLANQPAGEEGKR